MEMLASKCLPLQGFAFISIRMPWIVFPEALKTRPSGCGAKFTTKHPWPFQFWIACMTSRFGGSLVPSGAISCTGPCILVEHEHRWPSVMMDGLFVVWLQGYFKDAKPLVLE